MNYYILDDDINVVKMLSKIIEYDFNRIIVGSSCNPRDAIDEIKLFRPDIVLIDYLMPHLDGAEVIKDIVSLHKNIKFIMLSQVSDKVMIAEAYKAGISFFITKPINKIEIESVLEHIETEIQNTQKLNKIMTVLDFSKINLQPQVTVNDKIEMSLRDLGLIGEKSTQDIIDICKLKIDAPHLEISDIIIKYSKIRGESPKVIKQRIRRLIQKGLTNIAYIGIEDYMNDIFTKYSNSVYNFQSVKHEMDFIRSKQLTKGKVNMYKFLESVIHINQ